MIDFEQLLNECVTYKKQIWQIALEEENSEDVINCAKKSILVMKEAIAQGLKSSELSKSEMCGDDCEKLQKYYSQNHSLFGSLYEKITEYALATAEENIRMGRIVACPTAGSCGIVPAVLIALSEKFNLSEDEEINALITAGEIGKIISEKISLAGAVAGCQAECGVASAMAAAVAVQLMHGSPEQCINAAGLALKNILGLTCDPVCGLVEVPCVKRNVFLAVHAFVACELAMSGIVSKIPVDEIVDAMVETGQLMSPSLKESAQAGLARTKTALKLKEKMFEV